MAAPNAVTLKLGLALAAIQWMALPAMVWGQASQPADKPLWIAVAAPGLVKAIEPLARRRAEEGFEIQILDDTKLRTPQQRADRNVEPIRKAVRSCLPAMPRAGATKPASCYLVLVGFDPGGSGRESKFALPGGQGAFDNMVGRPSDAVIGDLDGDDLPDVSIGRLPARDVAELECMIAKIVRFESQADSPGEWQHRFVLLGGSPNYGKVIDQMIEGMVRSALDRLDGRWDGTVFYDNASSAFCLPPGELKRKGLSAIAAGAAVTLYMGHSSSEGFFLQAADIAGCKIALGGGPMIALSCFGAELAGRPGGRDAFAIEAMRSADGPVATFAAAGVSYPHWNKLLAEGLVSSLFAARPARLAEAIDGMRRRLSGGKLDLITLAALNMVDGSKKDLSAQRRGQLQMYSFFGDPAMRMPKAGPIEVSGPQSAQAGQTITIRGRIDDPRLAGSSVRVTARRSWSAIPPLRADQAAAERHAAANNVEVARVEVAARGGHFVAEVALPAEIAGKQIVVRAWAADGDAQAVGSCRVELRK